MKNNVKFNKYGTAYHIAIETPEDVRGLLALDDAFWTVTSAPTTAFREDPAFLKFLDGDGNGRIRTDEVRASIKWLFDVLADSSAVGAAADELPLASVNGENAAGKAMLVTANYVNEQAKRTDGKVCLKDVREQMALLRSKPLNGDGILIADAADDAALAEYITAAVDATGGSPDISGKTGVSSAQLETFAAAIPQFLEWKKLGDAGNSKVMPFGADTPAVYNLFERHRAEIDRFFFLSGFLRYDPAAAGKFIAADSSSDSPSDALDSAPLARPLPDGALPLCGDCVNPLHRAVIEALRDGLFGKVLGKAAPESATEADWNAVKAALAPYGEYLAAKKGGEAERFPVDKLEAWAKGDFAARAAALQTIDKEVADRCAAFADVEKLLLFHRDLPRFLRNYVSLDEFYDPKEVSLFECGRLLIDGRWFNLAVKITDAAAHAAVAKNGGLFTMYLKVGEFSGTPFTVVVPATAGTRGNLQVGKRGVFFDLEGREFDAVVTSIIENPISLKEAMFAPFKNIAKMVMGKIDAMSASSQASFEKGAESMTDNAVAGKAPAAPAAAPAGGMGAGGLLMGASVAIAALGSTFAFIAKSVASMSVTARITTLVVALLVIFGPILLAGVLKLLAQDMGPILEGCGWAVNKSMRLTRKLRRQFTRVLPFPKGARGTPRDRACAFFTLVAIFAAAYLFARYWECIRGWFLGCGC